MTSSTDHTYHNAALPQRFLLCTDLDRTLLPNGEAPESPGARSMFARMVAQPCLSLAYVSGRHLALVEESIQVYGLPQPDWILADVGSSVYQRDAQAWSLLSPWSHHIAADWQGLVAADLAVVLSGLPGLRLQPEDRQNTHKLSYFVSLDVDLPALLRAIDTRLAERALAANLIHSVDELAAVGLLDILPRRASKLYAIEFLMRRQGFTADQTLFAGDSGNDLSVLTSSLPAVLVANAHPDVVELALAEVRRNGMPDRLYVARGGFLGMNGNYSAGILEGMNHFHSEALRVLG
ncbi:HAD-IIB family hydrolase [Synechococcus sp. BA-132 BA5]|uniref:HAD-IIB family hydrolase n=1 Tax=Synechococcus sp. BA-132 BA5 TaxID=3110252 RepID=UPI002B1EFB49|nr:HAD-IIB family hydrolase [Synechococcus sp. BA-132 BA5]MEA5413520.1 HAD-IIB family hydrolase [Synechococcus sp. BA-132 BA5]